jgi:hypothetical protein
MLNGFYRVNFETRIGGAGAGVVVLENGMFRGGDSGMFYRGIFTDDGVKFSATVFIGRRTGKGRPVSVFKKDDLYR